MPRYKRSQSTIDSPFSTWHRRQHDGVNMVDIDVWDLSSLRKTTVLADTIYNIDFRFKGKDWWHQRPYKVLAEKLTFHTMKYSIP